MRRTEWLEENRKMRFEEVYLGWNESRLTQATAALVLGVFEEFYRAPNAKAQTKEGTGLGLAITKNLVNRFGGHISVKSNAGKETEFIMIFPIAAGKDPSIG
jgi:light-regulated signal transduction histidine kinase (bacteriophytochrome)